MNDNVRLDWVSYSFQKQSLEVFYKKLVEDIEKVFSKISSYWLWKITCRLLLLIILETV